MPLIFECILEIKKDHTFPVSIGINEYKFFWGKTQLALNSAQFTMVPKTLFLRGSNRR